MAIFVFVKYHVLFLVIPLQTGGSYVATITLNQESVKPLIRQEL